MEVLIAFTVAAAALGTLVYGMASAVRSELRAKANRSEMRLAQLRLESAGIDQPLTVGVLEGETGGLRWRQRTSRMQPALPVAKADARNLGRPAAELYWVEVAVAGGNGTEVRLATSRVVVAKP